MNRDVKAFLRDLVPDVRGTATALQEEIRDLLPDAVQKLNGGWRVIGYSHDGSMKTSICAIAPHPKHVNLQFFHGTAMSDPEGRLEGTGKRARHVKLFAPEDARSPAVRDLIKEAAVLAGE